MPVASRVPAAPPVPAASSALPPEAMRGSSAHSFPSPRLRTGLDRLCRGSRWHRGAPGRAACSLSPRAEDTGAGGCCTSSVRVPGVRAGAWAKQD